MSALRELVEAEDPGEDAREIELGELLSSLGDSLHKIALMYESELDVQSRRADHSLRESGEAFTTLLFLAEQVVGRQGTLRVKAERVDHKVEIRIETDGKRMKKEAEGRTWRDRVNEIRMNAADNYMATLGGVLRTSESGYEIELPQGRKLDNFSGGEIAHEFFVGIEKIKFGQLATVDPTHVAEDAVVQVSLKIVDDIKAEFDGAAVFVVMADARDFVANSGIDAEFLDQFAAKGVARLFARFDFAAGEFPFQRHRLVLGALADEDLISALQDGGHHLLHTFCPRVYSLVQRDFPQMRAGSGGMEFHERADLRRAIFDE